MIIPSIGKYFDNIDGFVKQVNSLNKSKDVLRTLEQRVDLLVLCMTFVEKSQNALLEYKEFNNYIGNVELVNLDYKISEYAKRLYGATLKVIEVFMKNISILKNYNITVQKRTTFLALSKKMLCISARWDIESFINVNEFDLPYKDRAYPKRKPLLQDVIFYANRMNATKLGIRFEDGIMPKRIIFAVQPNSGKSFVVNVYTVLAIIMHALYYNTSGVLRMSNNGGNACGFSDQIKAMIENDKIVTVFPELSKFFVNNKCRIFEKSTSEEWKLQELDPKIRASHFARGRDSAINSLRIFVLLAIDDLSDGFDQMNNDDAHKSMTTKYFIDMDSRKESEDIPEFIAGTMFNEFDVPNSLIKKLENTNSLIYDSANDNIRYTRDYNTVVIQIDCYDSKGNSIAPELISTEKLKDKQASLKPYEFDLVYRQIRASREPRIFDYKNLNTYTKLPKDISNTSIATLDPNRTSGNDFFAMPVFKYRPDNGHYALTDAIYEQKSLGKVSDPDNKFLLKVCKFIISNNITVLTLENNTSNTLGSFISDKLNSLGYRSCKIDEIFTHSTKGRETKMQRILSQEATIISNIDFPNPSILKPQSNLANFMEDFTKFDSKNNNGKKKHDDAPDSVTIFSDKHLFNKINRFSSITPLSKKSIFG